MIKNDSREIFDADDMFSLIESRDAFSGLIVEIQNLADRAEKLATKHGVAREEFAETAEMLWAVVSDCAGPASRMLGNASNESWQENHHEPDDFEDRLHREMAR